MLAFFFSLKTRMFLFVVTFYFSQLKDGNRFPIQKIDTIFQSSDLVFHLTKLFEEDASEVQLEETYSNSVHVYAGGYFYQPVCPRRNVV